MSQRSPSSSITNAQLRRVEWSVLGIDPGVSGAAAFLSRGVLRVARDFKTHEQMARDVARLAQDATFVVSEYVHPLPGEGSVSSFGFGKADGVALGAVWATLNCPVHRVAPVRWQNAIKNACGFSTKTKFKEITRAVAEGLFPAQRKLFQRVKDHNTADAVMIAVYGALFLDPLAESSDAGSKRKRRKKR